MRNNVINAIKSVATNKLNGKYNLAQYREGGSKYAEKVAAMTHKSICEKVLDFTEKHPEIPLYMVLAVGISADAMKLTTFAKGYKKFDAEKVLSVYNMGMAYNEYNGIGMRKLSDVTIRLMTRYYTQRSKDMATFMADLANSKVMGNLCGSREVDYNVLCANLNIPKVNRKGEIETAAA